jgi:hypothetical protein
MNFTVLCNLKFLLFRYTPSAVSVSGGKRPRCRDYDEKGFCLQGDQCKFDHGNDAVVSTVDN